jgi:hypothetical protein
MNPLMNALRHVLTNIHNTLFPHIPHPSFSGMFTPRSWRTTVSLILSLGRAPAVQWASHAWAPDPDFTQSVVQAVELLRFPGVSHPEQHPAPHPSSGQPVPSAPPPAIPDPRIDTLMQAVNTLTERMQAQASGHAQPPPTQQVQFAPQQQGPAPYLQKGSLPEASWSVGLPLPPGGWRRPAIWTAGWRDATTLRKLGQQMENGRDRSATAASVRSLTSLAASLLSMESHLGPNSVFDDCFLRTWLPLWSHSMAEQHKRQFTSGLAPGFTARATEALEASGGAVTESQATAALDQVAKRFRPPRPSGGGRQSTFRRQPSRGRASSVSSRGSSRSASRGRSTSASSRGTYAGSSRGRTTTPRRNGRNPNGGSSRGAGPPDQ